MRQQPDTYGMAPANMSSLFSSWQDNSRQMTKGTTPVLVAVNHSLSHKVETAINHVFSSYSLWFWHASKLLPPPLPTNTHAHSHKAMELLENQSDFLPGIFSVQEHNVQSMWNPQMYSNSHVNNSTTPNICLRNYKHFKQLTKCVYSMTRKGSDWTVLCL